MVYALLMMLAGRNSSFESDSEFRASSVIQTSTGILAKSLNHISICVVSVEPGIHSLRFSQDCQNGKP